MKLSGRQVMSITWGWIHQISDFFARYQQGVNNASENKLRLMDKLDKPSKGSKDGPENNGNG